MVTVDGHWYLDAYCHRAHDTRRFRVDRIVALRPGTGGVDPVGIEGRAGGVPPRSASEMFVPGPGAVEVRLALGPGAQWVPESVPVRAVSRDQSGSVTEVLLDVSGLAWFARLLLQLGPDARVLSPPELTTLATATARRVLARYEESSPEVRG